MSAAQNMVTYLLTHDGIPIIYYGQEQHLDGGTEPYTNRAALWEYKYDETSILYLLIAKLNLLRRHVSRNYAGYLTTESTTMDVQANTITFSKGGDVTVADIVAAGLARKNQPVKILGNGEISVKLNVTANKFSGSAKQKIEAAGGSVTETK